MKNKYARVLIAVIIGYMPAIVTAWLEFSASTVTMAFVGVTASFYEVLFAAPSNFFRYLVMVFCGMLMAAIVFRLGMNGYNIIAAAAIALIYEYELAILPRREGR